MSSEGTVQVKRIRPSETSVSNPVKTTSTDLSRISRVPRRQSKRFKRNDQHVSHSTDEHRQCNSQPSAERIGSMKISPSLTWPDGEEMINDSQRNPRKKRLPKWLSIVILAVPLIVLLLGGVIAATLVAVLITSTTTTSTTTLTTAFCNQTCLNGGTCVGYQVCLCPSTYTGALCQTPVCYPSCQNEGNCTAPGVCTCQFGWSGGYCQTDESILWTFDNTLTDLNGSYTGIGLNSPTFNRTGITGYGSALTLNGPSSQCVYMSPYLNMVNKSFSWEFWVYPTVSTMSDRVMINQCSPSSSTGYCMIFLLRNNKMLFAFWADDVGGSTSISANQWSHMAFVYDLNARTKTIYLNGVFEGQQTSSGSLMATTVNMTFGCELIPSTPPGAFYTGSIDQVRYFSRVKSASEILDDATLVVYFTFVSLAPLTDSSSNYINGTTGGSATIISSGVVDDAMNFPSSGSYFQVTGLVLIGTSNWPFSLSLWFKITSVSGGGTIAHLSSTTAGTGWCIGLIGLLPTGAVQVQIFNGTTAVPVQGPVMPVGVWQHVVQTFSTTNGLSLYINGTLYGRVATVYSASGSLDTLTFGNPLSGTACSSSFPNQQFYGSIDEVRLYSREITAAEISRLYSSP